MTENQNKTVSNKKLSVTAFIKNIDDPQKQEDAKALNKLFGEVAGVPAQMWGESIIGYGSYYYRYDSGREGDSLRIGFSPRKQNFSLYIMPGFEKLKKPLERLGKHKTSKACLYIKRLSDIDIEVLREIAERSWAIMEERYGAQ